MDIERIGRFDQSFVVHLIRDFFLLLLLVIILELGFRFLLVIYEFEHNEKVNTRIAAENLAKDLKSIMLNRGGPVAARTVYPILNRNHNKMGYEIALVPAKVTVTSMESRFGFTPSGLPPKWSEGKHHEFIVQLKAEKFCLKCHVHAKVNEVLGHVAVRSFLSNKLEHWWEEVRLTSVMGMGKIILHTVVLFFLLKIRMEPLLSLRSAVSRLAKGSVDISFRAKIKSLDEFGELTADLNAFLDRVTHMLEDTRTVLLKIATVNQRFAQVGSQMKQKLEKVHSQARTAVSHSFEKEGFQPLIFKNIFSEVGLLLESLESLKASGTIPEQTEKKIMTAIGQFQEVRLEYEDFSKRFDNLGKTVLELSNEMDEFDHFIKEMGYLRERLDEIGESGKTLLSRLIQKTE